MKDIFNFDDSRLKEEINRNYGLTDKIKTSFKYLEGKLPQNKITKTLRNIKTREGKSYEYFMFKDKEVSILVRQYSRHLTFYVYNRPTGEKEYYKRGITIFTVFDDDEKMTDDDWNEDDKITLKKVLPQIIELARAGKLHAVWNSLCLIVPKYTEVKLIADDTVHNLDTLIFACDEIAQLHLELFSENEVLEKIKTFKKGDAFGSVLEITGTRTVVKDNYFHGVGISTKRTDEFGMKHEKEDKWNDVYSLTRWYYDELFPSEQK